jgi:hypothetical protein
MVPDAAEQVVDALPALQAGVVGRQPVEALGHLGVGLEEGVGADAKAQPAELLLDGLGAVQDLGDAAGGGLADVERRASTRRSRADRLGEAVEVRRRPALVGRDDADLQLAGAATLAHDEVAQQAGLRAAVVGAQAALAAPAQRRAPRLVAGLGGQQAVLDVLDLLPGPGAWKPQMSSPSGDRAERVLELVAVAPLLDGGTSGSSS